MLESIEFNDIHCCPVCEENAYTPVGKIDKYKNLSYALEPLNIELRKCNLCFCLYKSKVLNVQKDKVNKEFSEKWFYQYSYTDELNIILQHAMSKDSLLDIGCNDGSFLSRARFHFHEISGIDILENEHCNRIINGVYVVDDIDHMDTHSFGNKKFDVITLFDTIEHMVDPRHVINTCRSMLAADGIIVVETGNYDTGWAKRNGLSNWWYINVIEHNMSFSNNTIHYLFDREGFQVIYCNPTRHKSSKDLNLRGKLNKILKQYLYSMIGDSRYRKICDVLGKDVSQPKKWNEMDHLFIIAKLSS